ncbi:MAG: NosD domain-containing protein [Promethearchaeota archaeon]
MRILAKKLWNKRLFGVMFLIFCFLNLGFFIQNYGFKEQTTKINHDKDNSENLKISVDTAVLGNLSELIDAGLLTGSGTYSDPYLIKDLILKGNGTGIGIQIGTNKDDYFRIENCTIYNFTKGIELFNSNNVTLYANNCSQNDYGIHMDGFLMANPPAHLMKYIGCLNNTLLENICNNNTYSGINLTDSGGYNKFIGNVINYNQNGIYLEGGIQDNLISGNILNQNKDIGIKIRTFNYNITGNSMKGSGLLIPDGTIEEFSLLNIDKTNIVNGKPIYYYVNRTKLSSSNFTNGGQIFLVNCSNVLISDLNVSYSSQGISSFHSNNVTVVNTDSSFNIDGIYISNTNNSYIRRNIVNNNDRAIYITGGCQNTNISENLVKNNKERGIHLKFFNNNNTFIDNRIINNFVGIHLQISSYNLISGNIIKNNTYGLEMDAGCDYSLIYENFFINNSVHASVGAIHNKWNSSEIGNYWDDYTGTDLDGNGIGDIPYNISISPLTQDYLPIVDIDHPNITIIKPSNNSVCGSTAPSFEIKVNERFLDLMWYTLDDGLHNFTITENGTLDQIEWSKLPRGIVTLKFFALDKVGNVANKEVLIIKVSGRIIISNNWFDAKIAEICTGSGNVSDPYVIKNLIINGGGDGVGILIVNSKKVFFRIENCTIFNCWYGIRLLRSCNGTLLNNNCSNNDNGIYLDGWTDKSQFTQEEFLTFYCMNNTVSNNIINQNAHYGIYTRNSDNNTITGNYINQNQYGIYLSYSNDNNTITNNFLRRNNNPGIFLEMGGDNIIKGNKMYSCGFYAWDELIFTYNIIDTTNLVNDGHLYFYANRTNLNANELLNAGQIYLINCSSSIISNLDLSDGAVSISLYDCIDIKVSHNNLSGNRLWGLYAEGCNKIIIENNFIDFNTIGLELRDFNNSMVLGNTVKNNVMYGIYLSGGYNNTFVNNCIHSNGYSGMRVFAICLYNNFTNNRFIGNPNEGLSFGYYSSYNIISGNIFKDNRIGMTADSVSGYNLFYENFFRDNVLDVEDNNINNKWNNTQIGNYWDNYTGIDSNGDGIGDIPYNISISPLIQDYLPIVDNNPPNITIIKPSNNTVFGSIAPSFEIEVNERFLDLMWYTLDGGLHNYTFSKNGTIDQAAWNLVPNGQVKLRFYAVDKVGYIAYEDLIIVKQKEAAIPGYNPMILLGLFVLFCFTLIKIIRNKEKKIRKSS